MAEHEVRAVFQMCTGKTEHKHQNRANEGEVQIFIIASAFSTKHRSKVRLQNCENCFLKVMSLPKKKHTLSCRLTKPGIKPEVFLGLETLAIAAV